MKQDEISAALRAALRNLPKDTLLRLRAWHALERDLEVAGCLGTAIKGALQSPPLQLPLLQEVRPGQAAVAATYDSLS